MFEVVDDDNEPHSHTSIESYPSQIELSSCIIKSSSKNELIHPPNNSDDSIKKKRLERQLFYEQFDDGGDDRTLSSDAGSSSSSEPDDHLQDRPDSPDLPSEYWQVQRLIKYIKAGNPTATIISLSSLRDYNLQNQFVQMSIKDSGGLEVLLNILETEEIRCKRAALLVIKDVTTCTDICRSIYNMRGLETLVLCLCDPSKELKLLTAETISNICRIKKARRAMRKNDGIIRLVDMLDIEKTNISGGGGIKEDFGFELAQCGGRALWSLAKSTKNRDAIRRAGAIPLLSKLMKSKQVSVVIPTVGILQECASEPMFRAAICSEGLLTDFVIGLKSPSHELVQFCAKAIYKCAEDKDARDKVYELGAIDPLMKIIQDSDLKKNKGLLAAATGAIWKCGSVICRNTIYLDKGLVELLVTLLENEPEEILINVAGALEEIAKVNLPFASVIKNVSGIQPLIKLLTMNNTDLLVNATRAVGALAWDTETRQEMEFYDGFRLVWSLLKHPSPLVQSSAAWAICPYVKSSSESGEMIRNYVGGLEALVELLVSDNANVQSAVCEAIAAIADNTENLSIMSDHGVVQFLAKITPNPQDNLLKRCIATATAECCKLEQNGKLFGQLNAVGPICTYISSKEPMVLREATKALSALSRDPRNCITIHQCGVVPELILLTESLDEELRNAAASVMTNIRCLALTTESIRLLH